MQVWLRFPLHRMTSGGRSAHCHGARERLVLICESGKQRVDDGVFTASDLRRAHTQYTGSGRLLC